MEEFNEVTVNEDVNEVTANETTEAAGFNPLVIGVGLGALAVLGANLVVKKVIKPAIKKHKDKKTAAEVVDSADYADAEYYDCETGETTEK